MTDLHQPMEELLTIIITTSPVQSNPSTFLTNTVINSLSLAPALRKCRKIIICDGVKISEGNRSNWKAGKANLEAITKYQNYIENLKDLSSKGGGEWFNSTILPLTFRHGFSYGALEGIKLVTTPYTMVIQHDRIFNQPVDVPTLLNDINYHHKIWVNYVQELLSACGIAHLKWDPRYPPGTFPPTELGMPPPPATPARIPFFGSLPEELQTKSALEVAPKWSVLPEEYTLNHLLAGYPVPFPIPYPQPSTGLPLNPEFNEPVTRVTQKYNMLLSPFDPNQTTLPQPAQTTLPSPFDPIGIDKPTFSATLPVSSATACSHFISRTLVTDNNNTTDIITHNTDSKDKNDNNNNNSSLPSQLGRVHFRKKQYPHPLPIHYINFPTNQTQKYLSHCKFEKNSPGALPAYFTSAATQQWLKNPQYLKAMLKVRDPSNFNKIDHDTDSGSGSDSSNSDSDSQSDDSGSSDSDHDNISPTELFSNPHIGNTTTAQFNSLPELIEFSQAHLQTALGKTLEELSQYQFAPRLVPMMYWFDSTHIALTRWYKELYTTEERGGFPLLRPGDFAEDRYIQFQNALSGIGSYLEAQNAKGNFDTPDEWDNKTIGTKMALKMEQQHLSDPDASTTATTTAVSCARPTPALMELANHHFIGFPIDQNDNFNFTVEQACHPFIFGAPPHFRVKDLKQVAFRIARCGRVKTFTDAHNLSLREMGLWLYEHNPISYDNFGNDIQDPITHQQTCLAMKWYDAQDKHCRKTGSDPLQKGGDIPVSFPHAHSATPRQMICGHDLIKVNTQYRTSLAQTSDGQDMIEMWAVRGMDFPAAMSIKHLDGKAWLRVEQKLEKKMASLKEKKRLQQDPESSGP